MTVRSIRSRARCLLATACLLAACSTGQEVDQSAALGAEGLVVVPIPTLDTFDPGVQRQLEAAYANLLPRGEDAGLAAMERGEAYGELGRLFMAASLPTSAEPALRNARVLTPANPEWAYYLAQLLRAQGNIADAVELFQEAVQQEPEDLATLYWLGQTYLDLNRTVAAEAAFTRALAAHPESPAARAGLGQSAFASRDYTRAVAELEAAVEMVPAGSALHYPLALAYRALGDETSAERHVALVGREEVPPPDPRMAAIENLLDSALVHERRGVEAMDRGLLLEAMAEFRDGLTAAPPGDSAMRLSLMNKLGSVYWLRGDVDEAIAQFEAGIALSPGFALNHYNLGVIQATQGDLDGARRRFETAVLYEPDLVQAQIALGNALHGLGQPGTALAHYEHALQVDPDSADARYAQAAALVDVGRIVEARALLAEGIARHPDDQRFTQGVQALDGF